METVDGISLSVGGAAVGTICTCLVQMWKARHQKTEIAPNPLSIEQTAYQASQKENAKDHENLFGRVARLEQSVSRIDAKFEAGEVVDGESLVAKGIIKHADALVKVLGDGEITKAVTVKGLKVSASAQAKIEAAGGKVE